MKPNVYKVIFHTEFNGISSIKNVTHVVAFYQSDACAQIHKNWPVDAGHVLIVDKIKCVKWVEACRKRKPTYLTLFLEGCERKLLAALAHTRFLELPSQREATFLALLRTPIRGGRCLRKCQLAELARLDMWKGTFWPSLATESRPSSFAEWAVQVTSCQLTHAQHAARQQPNMESTSSQCFLEMAKLTPDCCFFQLCDAPSSQLSPKRTDAADEHAYVHDQSKAIQESSTLRRFSS